MDTRTKVAAAWWTNALRENHQRAVADGSAQEAPRAEELSEQQLEAFEAALAREIGAMLTCDLTHVLAVNNRWAAPQFAAAAATCGIDGIIEKLPRDTVMRIFPNTVMAHSGPQSQVEILWSNKRPLSDSDTASARV